MRLRLLVKRHTLPDCRVVWPVSEDVTISQLLEQLNEVVPLESEGEWGLEDYAVELRGPRENNFECLHFPPVGDVLADNDEVVIRPLLSADVRQRRISGRRQVSSDGRHLFDGFPFGRPRPRELVPRPTISIPPRKRRRITYYDEHTGASEAGSDSSGQGILQGLAQINGNEMVLHANFEDDDDEEDEEDDEDFEPESSRTSDSEESQSVLDDNDVLTTVIETGSGNDQELPPPSSPKLPSKLRLKDLRAAFPSAPEAVCRQIWKSSTGDYEGAWQILARGFKPLRSVSAKSKPRKTQLAGVDEYGMPIFDATSNFSTGPEQQRAKDGPDALEPDEPIDNTKLRYYDQHGLPTGSISTSSNASLSKKLASARTDDKARPSALRKGRRVSAGSNMSVSFADDAIVSSGRTTHEEVDTQSAKPTTTLESDTSSESEDEDSEEDSDDSDGISNETKESDDESEASQADSSSQSDSGSDSDSDTSSSGTSSSEEESDDSSSEIVVIPEQTSTKPVTLQPSEHKVSEKSLSTEPHTITAVPPGRGKPATRARNERRRKSMVLRRLIESAMLPAGTTLVEFNQLDMPSISTREGAFEALARVRERDQGTKDDRTAASMTDAETEFESRRRQLLESIAGGGVDIDLGGHGEFHATTSHAKPVSSMVSETWSSEETPPTVPEALNVGTTTDAAQNADEQRGLLEAFNVAHDDAASRPRMRLNIGAGRRLLFGALGLKAPKTKSDEDKLKQELMKDVRPVKPVLRAVEDTEENEVSADEDPDAWREKITLRAVECCSDGVEYSEPPFPFRQRWDPQQWGGYSGDKKKKKARKQAQFYEDEPVNKKLKSKDSQLPVEDHEEDCDTYSDQRMGHDLETADGGSNPQGTDAGKTSSDAADVEIKQQLLAESQSSLGLVREAEMEDLPIGPPDKTSLPILLRQDIVPGLVIVFKQLIMSEATQWQPQMSDYMTAVILDVDVSGEFRARLAERDRVMTEKYYDEDTGERVYGKFEVPDDEDEMEDDGCISISFDELVEPRIVQAAPLDPMQNDIQDKTDHNDLTDMRSAISSAQLNDEELPTVADIQPPSLSQESYSIHDDVMTGTHYDFPARIVEADLFDVSIGHVNTISDTARQEGGDADREAGFRSSIPSSMLRAAQLNSVPGVEETTRNFPSSPPLNDIQSLRSSPVFETLRSVPPSPNVSCSPHPFLGNAQIQDGAVDRGMPEVHYPRMQRPVSLDGDDTEHERQPDFSPPGQGTLDDFVETGQDSGDFEGLSARAEVVYDVPLIDESVISLKEASRMPSHQVPAAHASSDINLPDLDDVFEIYSTARSSVLVKPERTSLSAQPLSEAERRDQESYEAAMAKLDEEELDSHNLKAENSPGPFHQNRTSASVIKMKAGNRRSKTSAEDPFEVPSGSQQVDLTLDSEISPPPPRRSRTVPRSQSWSDDASWHEGSGLPTGPGWVQKKKRAAKSMDRTSISQSQGKRNGKETLKQRLNRRKSAASY